MNNNRIKLGKSTKHYIEGSAKNYVIESTWFSARYSIRHFVEERISQYIDLSIKRFILDSIWDW